MIVRGTVATGARTRTPVAGGYIGVVVPQTNGWCRWGFGPCGGIRYGGTTEPDGTYVVRIELSLLSQTRALPAFIAASDAAGTLTMLSELPPDLCTDGADITIDVNPSTTAASQMICPGGTYPPPANTWCYSDPKTASVSNTGLIGVVDGALGGTLISLEPGAPPNWEQFASGLLNDPSTFDAIKTNLTGRGITLGAATPASIASSIGAARLPIVLAPGAGSSTDSGPPTGGACKLVWDCKTSTQCAQVYGAKTGSTPQKDAATCNATCKQQGACTCQGC